MDPTNPLRGARRARTGTAAGVTAGLLVLSALSSAGAADWPHWRGPQSNGISSETGWLSRWGAGGPRKLWTAQVGEGYASVAVAAGRAYTVGNNNGQDTVYCLNADTGQVLWRQSYRCEAGNYGGPRATPWVDGNSVFTMSREAVAYCLNAQTGKVVWTRNLRQESRAQDPQWAFAGSPYAQGNSVFFNVGTAGIALNKATGVPEWVSGSGRAGYASPVPYTVGGKRGLAFFGGSGLAGLDPETGKPQWQFRWSTSHDVNAADPIFTGDSVFVSTGYNVGCALVKLTGGAPRPVWQNKNMRNHFNSSVLVNGTLFGNDDGRLRALDLANGQERWSGTTLGKGGLIAADGKLILLTERGELVIAEAKPDRYAELARARVVSTGDCWTQPALANGRIYCRSHSGELVCVDVRGASVGRAPRSPVKKSG